MISYEGFEREKLEPEKAKIQGIQYGENWLPYSIVIESFCFKIEYWTGEDIYKTIIPEDTPMPKFVIYSFILLVILVIMKGFVITL